MEYRDFYLLLKMFASMSRATRLSLNFCYISSGCEPIGIWGFFRNGKTYPTEQYAQRMKAALFLRNYIESSSSIGNSSLCAQDVENLKNLPINNDMFKLYDYLNEEGHQDMVDIGRRLQHTFPELLKNLKDEDVTFISTGEIGVDNSMKAFIKGLGNLNFVTPTEDEVKMISVSSDINNELQRQLFVTINIIMIATITIIKSLSIQ